MKKLICILSLLLLISTTVFGENFNSVSEHFNEVLSEEKALKKDYITRSEFVAVLMKSMNYTKDLYICSFYDIHDADWNYVYIANAQHKKIALGNTKGGFSPQEPLSVQEAVTFVSRAFKINSVYQNDSQNTLPCAEYAADYIKYAIANEIYPKNNNSLLLPNELISTDLAIKLISDYMDNSSSGENYIKFVQGYPKLYETGNTNSIGIAIKTNKPCKIYSKIIPSKTTSSIYLPQREQVNTYLTTVSDANSQITVEIPAKKDVSYNIYLTAVDEKGAISKVYALKDVMPIPFTEGNGTKANPYRIYDAQQLEYIRVYPDKCYLLCNDIEYNGNWEPVGISLEQSDMFCGTFDGGGHSITGLRIDAEKYSGFFAVLFGGTVKNLNIFADVSGENYVGIIAGESTGGTIENCHIAGFCEASENIAGGIVGKNNGYIKNCVSAAYTVTSTAYSGGIVGSNTGYITNCISAVTSVYSDMYASSIAGINTHGEIENCVGACIEVIDTLTSHSGRISTNRENGICWNNYAYDGMISGENVYRNKNGQDGEEVSWEQLQSAEFYKKTFDWDFNEQWEFITEFCLPSIRNTDKPHLQPGITVYAPLGIENEKELINIKNNLDGHYYLENDITLSDTSWLPLGLAVSNIDYESGFKGSFDGRGHTISNLRIDYDENISQYGLFGIIYGGSVRNVNLENANIEGHSYVGALAGINYGNIASCTVSGKIQAYQYDRETLAGGICAINYTNIYSSDCFSDISINATSATAGGIAAQNEGFIDGCNYDAELVAHSEKKSSNAVLGGIVGINYSGMIYNCYAAKSFTLDAYTSYCGGIAGIMNGGEIYKCASYGNIFITANEALPSYSYTGGIAGMMNSALIMNSFTQCNLSIQSDIAYTGGILGFSEFSSIQNVYSLNTINQLGDTEAENMAIFAGGILGYNINGNISGAVAINPYITTNGYSSYTCAYSDGGYVDNNYYTDAMFTNGKKHTLCEDGISKNHKTLKNIDFFTNPVEHGGLLGWFGSQDGEKIWIRSTKASYPFPVLYGVKNQDLFSGPKEFHD